MDFRGDLMILSFHQFYSMNGGLSLLGLAAGTLGSCLCPPREIEVGSKQNWVNGVDAFFR